MKDGAEEKGAETEAALPADEPMDDDGLTLKQRRFIIAYLGVSNGNATDAARRAGYETDYDTLRSIGSENLTKPNIARVIARMLDEEAMPAREVLARLSRHARSSIADLFDTGGSSRYPIFNPAKAFETGGIHGVAAIVPMPDGSVRVEMESRQNALNLLGKYHKLFTDRQEISQDVLIREYPEGV
jgi:phage terminase small subunit